MTGMKIRDRENRNIFTGFWGIADFFTGNRNSIPPCWAPLKRGAKIPFRIMASHDLTLDHILVIGYVMFFLSRNL